MPGDGNFMKKEFKTPKFGEQGIEIRVQDGEVCIYGSTEGIPICMGMLWPIPLTSSTRMA